MDSRPPGAAQPPGPSARPCLPLPCSPPGSPHPEADQPQLGREDFRVLWVSLAVGVTETWSWLLYLTFYDYYHHYFLMLAKHLLRGAVNLFPWITSCILLDLEQVTLYPGPSICCICEMGFDLQCLGKTRLRCG